MFRTLTTLWRAQVSDAEDRLIDANGTQLLAQHLRDAEADQARARRALAALVARRKAEERRIEGHAQEIARREADAARALEADQEALAEDIAERIVILEDERKRAETARADLGRRIDSLRSSLAEVERRIAALAAELRAARTSEIWRKSRAATAAGADSGALERAEAMAKRLGAQVRSVEDEMEEAAALRTSAADDLDARMEEAGLATQRTAERDAVLDRIRKSRSTPDQGDDT